MKAANDDVFDPNEPRAGAVLACVGQLNTILTNDAFMYADVTKKLKAKLAFFGDATSWSVSNIEKFNELMTMSLLVVARAHAHQERTIDQTSSVDLIEQMHAAIDAVVRLDKKEALGK